MIKPFEIFEREAALEDSITIHGKNVVLNDDIIIFYHYPCTDGLTAAWIANRLLAYKSDNNVTLVPINYSDEDRDIQRALGQIPLNAIPTYSVIFVDYCPTISNLLSVANQVHNVHIYDHHPNVFKLVGIEGVNHNILFACSKKVSGAFITNYMLKPDDMGINFLVHYVSDYDSWSKELEGIEEFNAYAKLNWKELANITYDYEFSAVRDIIEAGGRILKTRESIATSAIKESLLIQTINHGVGSGIQDTTTVAFVNCPGELSSSIPELLSKEYKEFPNIPVLSFRIHGKKVFYSVRTNKQCVLSAQTIAEAFGGGGHEHAAGFNTSIEDSHLMKDWCINV